MTCFYSHLTRLWNDDRGQDLIEYGLLAAAIAAVGVAVFPIIFTKLDNAFTASEANVWGAWEPANPAP